MRECLKGQACKTFSQPSTMSSSDSESTCSDLTDASEKSDVGSPVIQNLDIIMVTDATVGSGDDETNAVGKTVQMTAKNSSKTDAEGNDHNHNHYHKHDQRKLSDEQLSNHDFFYVSNWIGFAKLPVKQQLLLKKNTRRANLTCPVASGFCTQHRWCHTAATSP